MYDEGAASLMHSSSLPVTTLECSSVVTGRLLCSCSLCARSPNHHTLISKLHVMHAVVFYALDVVNSVFPCLLPLAMPSFGGGEWKFGIMTLRAMTEASKRKPVGGNEPIDILHRLTRIFMHDLIIFAVGGASEVPAHSLHKLRRLLKVPQHRVPGSGFKRNSRTSQRGKNKVLL